MNKNFTISRKTIQHVRQSFQWDQARIVDAGDGVFRWLADVDEKSFEISGYYGAEFGGGDGFHMCRSERAGGGRASFRIVNRSERAVEWEILDGVLVSKNAKTSRRASAK